MNRFKGLDHLRALAIILVWFYHYRAFSHPDWVDNYAGLGWTGVDLFFVLSGFLISNQLFSEIRTRQDVNLKTFYTKRFFRIIPPYAFLLLLYFAIPFFREREALPPLWKFLTFTQNYGLDVVNKGTFSHAWSLCIEEQFYLVLPFLLVLLLRTKVLKYVLPLAVAAMIVSVSLRCYYWNHAVVPQLETDNFWRTWYMNIYYPTHTRLDALSIGVMIGFLFQYAGGFQQFVHANGKLLLIAGISMLGLSGWFCYNMATKYATIFGFSLMAISYGLIVVSSISDTCFLSKSSSLITTKLAGFSYAIYLSHKGIIHITQYWLKQYDIPENLLLVICFSACVAGSILIQYSIERPSHYLKKVVLHRITARSNS